MAVDFPSSPTVGQPFTSGGVTWMWDGVKWTSTSAATGVYLPITGGTMQGDLILNRDAQVALGAATLEQVQARGSGANRIINGDMRIDQRNNGAQGTATGVYTVDRWVYGATQASKGTWLRQSGAATAATIGFGNYFNFVSSSAYASLATDNFRLFQRIEADLISDFQWGAASAQPVTLSFWAFSSLTGMFSGSIQNDTLGRSYPFSYSIPIASTWTKIAVTIPGDTGGTWVLTGNGAGVLVTFDYGSGSNFRGAAGAWASSNYYGVTGAVSVVGTNGATFNLTGVKLEIGSIATPFNRQSLAKSQADCERYFRWCGFNQAFNAVAGFLNMASSLSFSAMRASPTASSVVADPNTTSQGSNLTADVIDSITPYSVRIYTQATAAGAAYINGYRFSLSAEL